MRDRDLAKMAAVGVLILVAALLGLASLQYGLPARYYSIMGLGKEDVPHFLQNLHLPPFPPMSIPRFLGFFRQFLIGAWFGYIFAVIAGLRGGILKRRTILAVMIPLAAALAVWWPASLSGDVYGYVGFGRMFVYHGMNPYTHTPADLCAAGDPCGPFARFRHPTIYGPVWTLLSVIIVWLLKSAGLWWQVVAMKLLAGASLVLTALVGSRIAERFRPGTGDLTLLAIGLNPLFLIEGPGNGHNDLLMMLLLLAGVLYLMKKQHIPGSLALGASIGIKFISVMAVPWLVWEYTQGRRMMQRVSFAGICGLLVLVPNLICYLPFWHGGALFQGAAHRWHWGMSWSASSKQATLTYWLTRRLPDVWMDRVAFLLTGPIAVVIIFGALSVWLLRKGVEGSALTAWVILSGCLALFTMGVPFPWYLAWAWMASLVRWDRAHFALSAAYCAIGFICTYAYTISR